MTRGTYWRCAACGFACDKDNVCPDCGYHTLVQEDFPDRKWEGLSVFEINDLVENTEYEDYRDLVERTEAKLKEKNT